MCSSASLQRPHGSLTITSGRPSRAERCRPQSGCCCPENSPNTRCQRAPRPSPNTPAPSDHLWAVQERRGISVQNKSCKMGHVCNHSSIWINPLHEFSATVHYPELEEHCKEESMRLIEHIICDPGPQKYSLKSLGYTIAKNALYGSKLSIFLLCQKIIRILSKDCAQIRYFVHFWP